MCLCTSFYKPTSLKMIDLTACYMNDLKILRGQSIKSNDMRKNIEEEEEKRYQSKKRA